MMATMRLTLLVLLPTLLFAKHKVHHTHPGVDTYYEPWFTGPLLAPTPVNMERGHPAIEPAIVVSNTYGLYNDNWKLKNIDDIWGFNYLVDFQLAFTDNTGLEIIGSAITNKRGSKSSTHFEDTMVLLGYQVSNDQKDSWVPDFRLLFQVTFPTGKYKNLDPSLLGLDLTGQGAYSFGPNLSFQKLFYLEKNFFSLQWSIGYFIPTRVDVAGFNAYIGGNNASGSLCPGSTLLAFLSGEYSLNQRWVLAFDTQYEYQTATSSFRGNPGTLQDGSPSTVGLPSSFQFSVAPEIEYNITKQTGLLGGLWFSLAGRNSTAFASAFLAFVHVF